MFLDARAERVRSAAIGLPWEKPKIVLSGWSGRDGRGDSPPRGTGRACCSPDNSSRSGRFKLLSDSALMAFATVLNGPVANAYVAARNGDGNIRIGNLAPIPIPRRYLLPAGALAADYEELLAAPDAQDRDGRMERLLTEIDARVLTAYDLPPRLERRLLERFRGEARPVEHRWRHWADSYPTPGLTLAERMSESGRAYPCGSP